MGKILARNGEQREKEKWVDLIGDIAGCISIKRPKEVQHICIILTKALNRPQKIPKGSCCRCIVRVHTGDFSSVMEEMVEALCRHVSDDSPTVRRLCLRGLVQVTETASNDAVEPILLNLSVRLRNLQISIDPKMRASAFSAFKNGEELDLIGPTQVENPMIPSLLRNNTVYCGLCENQPVTANEIWGFAIYINRDSVQRETWQALDLWASVPLLLIVVFEASAYELREEEKIGVLVDEEGVKKAVKEFLGERDGESESRRAKELWSVSSHLFPLRVVLFIQKSCE
ncbi:hypothetical protein HID58_057875 [Brassica napus]|uniref:Uncharacterized protein n=1 Tax=Brassica napus TaxID=3708 RepID=A0ABQ7ZNH7_BRANA|nr:hypothetical protein HID58_057875 [Brassica napus]